MRGRKGVGFRVENLGFRVEGLGCVGTGTAGATPLKRARLRLLADPNEVEIAR